MAWFSSAFIALVAAATVHGASVSYDWKLAAKTILPDGFHRSASLVNGVFPGPVLTANKGDSVTINVHNQLADPTMLRSTSIHWHGILQPHNAYNDGPSFVTQCPIAPNHSYLYKLALGDQSGTYWYHSHLSTQYVDGIRGPLIVYDPHDPQKNLYDVDDASTIITLADWHHPTALNQTNAFFAGAPEPVPDSGLVNGVGRFTGGPKIPWARVNVQAGKRYRLRLIGLSAAGQFEFSIAQHSMTVIEADGIAHQPYKVDSIPVMAGQRYSVIITANQPVANYWIGATMTIRGSTTSPTNPIFNGSNVFAVLHYDKAPNADPTVPPPTGLPAGGVEFEEFNLQPLVNPGAPGGDGPADQTFNFTFAPDLTHPNGNRWIINNIQYQSPTTPTLLKVLSNKHTNESEFAPSEHTLFLKRNVTVEIMIIGGAGHPFHLHGHAFDVIRSASGGNVNFLNPPRRDVVSSGGTPDDPVRIRFRTDNDGPWMFHCHIDWHLAAGLAAVFLEDPDGIQKTINPSPQWDQLCSIYNALPPELQ